MVIGLSHGKLSGQMNNNYYGVFLVFFVTLSNAVGQYFLKLGAENFVLDISILNINLIFIIIVTIRYDS